MDYNRCWIVKNTSLVSWCLSTTKITYSGMNELTFMSPFYPVFPVFFDARLALLFFDAAVPHRLGYRERVLESDFCLHGFDVFGSFHTDAAKVSRRLGVVGNHCVGADAGQWAECETTNFHVEPCVARPANVLLVSLSILPSIYYAQYVVSSLRRIYSDLLPRSYVADLPRSVFAAQLHSGFPH